MSWWWFVLGCDGGDGGPADGVPTDAGDTDLAADTGHTASPPAGHTGWTGPCAADPSLSVTSLTAADGNSSTQREIRVRLSAEAPVAVRCAQEGDPVEVHLLESLEPATEHVLRFSGLLPESTYLCEAAPTCPTLAGAPAAVEVTTGPRPMILPDAAVTVEPGFEMTGAFTLMNWRDGTCARLGTPWAVAYDPEGRLRWWKQFPEGLTGDIEVLWHAEDDSVVWGGGYSPDGRPHVSPMWGPDTYASEQLADSLSRRFHHDTKRLPDGRILSLEDRQNRQRLQTWTGFGVRLHDPLTGRLDLDLDSQVFVDRGELRPGANGAVEPYHANAVEYVAGAGGPDRLYVSLCFDRSILGVDPATGALRWRLAQGEGWTVVDAAGQPLPDSVLPECQHGFDVLGEDRLLVYDNGQLRQRSQLLDLTVDAAARRVTVNWQWDQDLWYEDTLGDVDELGNGRVLVNRAHPECWSNSPGRLTDVIEVDRATGVVVSRLELPGVNDASYRAQRYGGCEFLPGTRFCPATLERLEELEPLFGRGSR